MVIELSLPRGFEKWLIRSLVWIDAFVPAFVDTKIHVAMWPWNEQAKGGIGYSKRAGVWIEDRSYYEALGIPLGIPPPGADVFDRYPGVPESAFGNCYACKRSWKWVDSHPTIYSESSACFPLCQMCWESFIPEQRLPYYRALFDEWERQSPQSENQWEQIRAAVLAEGKGTGEEIAW